MNWLPIFLSSDEKVWLDLARGLSANLDTDAERKAAADYGVKMLKNGKVPVVGWAKFGSKLGILTGKH